ncbi:MAG TPA: DUF932 domain-containing protein [Candidatus Acidoferrum sp.]
MAHNLDFSTGKAGLAFRGDRNDIWHRLGQEMQPGQSIDEWQEQAGLNWTAEKVAAFADLSLLDACQQAGTGLPAGMARAENRHFIVRSDNGYILSPQTVSDRYTIVQPREALEFFEQYVSVDDRFAIDTAMCLKSGEIIAATAVFNGDTTINGDLHRARLLMTTTYDGSGATIAKATMTRVVCNNTLNAAIADGGKSVISTRHNTKFNAERVGKELANIASGFAAYKAMGEAMAAKHFADVDVSRFFKLTLDIDPAAKKEDISTRKFNQYEELFNCYHVGTRREGLEPRTAWSMLQGVTRYCDHNRSTSGSNGTPAGIAESRFLSANFGSGAQMKAQAVALLDEMSDGDLLRAVSQKTADDADVSGILKQAFRPSRG